MLPYIHRRALDFLPDLTLFTGLSVKSLDVGDQKDAERMLDRWGQTSSSVWGLGEVETGLGSDLSQFSSECIVRGPERKFRERGVDLERNWKSVVIGNCEQIKTKDKTSILFKYFYITIIS